MRRITPRTCLWPMIGCLCLTFLLSFGLTFQSNHACYAGTCGEWLFPFQARLHVAVWYSWLSLSVLMLSLRAFQSSIRNRVSQPLGIRIPYIGKQLRISGIILIFWIGSLYGILIGIWWVRLRDYFEERGQGLPGNQIVAAVALTGHLADVTLGMVLLPVSRHSALASFFKLSPTSTYTFHMTQAYVLFGLVIIHGSLYADWAAIYNGDKDLFRHIYPVLNPTYLYHEVWPGSESALGIWRASLIFSGVCSSLIMILMFLTSFPSVRASHFNLFYFTHLLGIIAVVLICLHASTMFYCTIPGLAMWLLDWGMRLTELSEKLPSQLEALGNGWYSLTLYLPRRRLSGCACHSPLAHFYIHHSQTSLREIHPFTTTTHLASQKTQTNNGIQFINIQFLFRQSLSKRLQWTSKLTSILDEENFELRFPPTHGHNIFPTTTATSIQKVETPLRLEGPYFTPANPELYETVICLVAGTGLSGAIAIAAAFASQTQPERSDRVTKCDESGSEETCEVATRSTHRWKRCIVVWIVREEHYVDMPFFKDLRCKGLVFKVFQTGGSKARPNIKEILREIRKDEEDDCWCYISGPNGFISSAEHACAQAKMMKWFSARWD